MLTGVPDVYIGRWTARSNHEMILGHVPCAVHLAVVGDLHFDIDFTDPVDGCVAAKFVLNQTPPIK